jgi:hypothetical protein
MEFYCIDSSLHPLKQSHGDADRRRQKLYVTDFDYLFINVFCTNAFYKNADFNVCFYKIFYKNEKWKKERKTKIMKSTITTRMIVKKLCLGIRINYTFFTSTIYSLSAIRVRKKVLPNKRIILSAAFRKPAVWMCHQ